MSGPSSKAYNAVLRIKIRQGPGPYRTTLSYRALLATCESAAKNSKMQMTSSLERQESYCEVCRVGEEDGPLALNPFVERVPVPS